MTHSGVLTLITKHILPINIDEAWNFFTNPEILQSITHTEMRFEITSPALHSPVFDRQIITYKVNVLPGIRINWVTEILHIIKKKLFVDEQRFWPYKFWHHKHLFFIQKNGMEIIDEVTYKPPLSLFGNVISRVFCNRNSFEYSNAEVMYWKNYMVKYKRSRAQY